MRLGSLNYNPRSEEGENGPMPQHLRVPQYLKACPECNGSGTIVYERVYCHSPSRDVGFVEEYEDNCENCHGSGEIDDPDDEVKRND